MTVTGVKHTSSWRCPRPGGAAPAVVGGRLGAGGGSLRVTLAFDDAHPVQAHECVSVVLVKINQQKLVTVLLTDL